MLFFRQLVVLIWKNWKLRLRSPCATLEEVGITLFYPIIFVFYLSLFGLDFTKMDVRNEFEDSKLLFTANFNGQYRSAIRVPNVYITPPDPRIEDIKRHLERLFPNNILQAQMTTSRVLVVPNDITQLKANVSANQNSFGVVIESYPTAESPVLSSKVVFNADYDFMSRFQELYSVSIDDFTTYIELGEILVYLNGAILSKLTEDQNANRSPINSFITYHFPRYKPKLEAKIAKFFAAVMAFAVISSCTSMTTQMVKRIAEERSAKIRELMRMMGLSDWVFWTAYFVDYLSIALIASLFNAFVLTTNVYKTVDYSVLFIALIVFNIQLILFCMAFSTLFNSPILVTSLIGIVQCALLIIPVLLWDPNFSSDATPHPNWCLASSLTPSAGLYWVLSMLARSVMMGERVALPDMFKENGYLIGLTVGLVLAFQLLSWILYIFLIWYFDNILVEYGVRKPLYFPCLPSYYFPTPEPRSRAEVQSNSKNEFFESEQGNSKVTITINNVKKDFGGNKGVFGVTLDIYSGQITALLGHNGAGKTTTMNMITGLYPPTSGTIHIDGYDIVTSTKTARKSIGLCPQENVLYDDLTVREHLKLYAVLKGCPTDRVNNEIEKTLELTKMNDKKDTRSKQLSGGLKRKLSLGIALIGKTKILIMDELTTGLDPENRRAIWDILHDIRKERTILITTHYMEEADILGDRIAIMAEGRVKCCGSPMFLKRKFGAGYSLRISKSKSFNQELTDGVLKKHLPESQLKNDNKTEIIYSLESENSSNLTDRNKFPILFDELDERKQELGIESYGLNVTTMEDVFIKVGSQADVKENKEFIVTEKYNKLEGNSLFRQRVYGLLVKRVQYGLRNYSLLIYQFVVTAIMMIAIFLLSSKQMSTKVENTLSLDLLSLYGQTQGFFRFDSEEWRQFGQNIYSIRAKKHGMTASLISENTSLWLKNIAEATSVSDYSQKYSLGGSVTRAGDAIFVESWNNPAMIHSLPMSINLMYESLIAHFVPNLRNDITIRTTIEPIIKMDEILEKILVKMMVWHVLSCIILAPFMFPLWASTYILFPIEENASNAKFLQLMTGLSKTTYWFSNFIYDFISHELVVALLLIISYSLDFKGIIVYELGSVIAFILLLALFGMSSIALAYLSSIFFTDSQTGFTTLYVISTIAGSAGGIITSLTIIGMTWTPISYTAIRSIFQIFRIFPVVSMAIGFTKLYGIGATKWVCRLMDQNYNMSQLCAVSKDDYDKVSFLTIGCCDNLCKNIDVFDKKVGSAKQLPGVEMSASMCFRSRNVLSTESLGIISDALFLIASTIVSIILIILIEVYLIRLWKRFWNKGGRKITELNDEENVSAERFKTEMLVRTDRTKEEALVVYDIMKYFKNFRAVYRLSFRVHHNECFGLLGVNGAGKTTTFQVLTGDIECDRGNAFIGANDLLRKTKGYQQNIGYCPQFSAIIQKLTAEEMLYLFARLRGIPEKYIHREVESIIRTTDIEQHCKTSSKDLSGGNQRKLSLALAIIGSPQLILLDEPTSGVDPVARRKIWQTLNELKSNKKSSIILTSHSMDETQALCSRIAIMVSGELKCLGSTQQLKTKYGQGFDVVIKIKRQYTSDKQYSEKVSEYMKKEIPSSVKRDFHESVISYHISDPSVKWSTMFRVMQSAEREFDFEDYSLSDTSLEQIFLSFAKQK